MGVTDESPDETLQEIRRVVTALAKGNFRQRVQEPPSGLLGEIASALNSHCEILEQFAKEHVRITNELGVIGRLGGQAEVFEPRGTWHSMISSLNHLAICVTEQIRDVSSVADALSRGDTSRHVTSNLGQGEYATLRDRMNTLVDQRGNQPATSEPAGAGH
jgi:hypothetical protein